MKSPSRSKRLNTEIAWAWEIWNHLTNEWQLCRWSEPFKESLNAGNSPGHEARKVCVRMIRNSDYLKAGLRLRGQRKKVKK